MTGQSARDALAPHTKQTTDLAYYTTIVAASCSKLDYVIGRQLVEHAVGSILAICVTVVADTVAVSID